jgi:isopenicillin N synthase-like dioxygenase
VTVDAFPVVSLADPPDVVARDLAAAYTGTGFCLLVDHDVPVDAVEAVFEASRRLHALPDEAKRAVEIGAHHRGFVPIDTSTVRASTVAEVRRPNQSESFLFLHRAHPDDIAAGRLLAGPNRWPEGSDDLRAPVERYQHLVTALGRRLVPLVARALGAPDDAFGEAFDRPTTWLRLLWYPPRPAGAPDDLYGSAPHTDYGFVTLLAPGDVPGLQILLPDGRWVDAPIVDGAFVVNAGDLLHRWSNGRFRSTPHRVLNRSGRERWSVAFFFDPDVRTVVSPLPGLGTPRFDALRVEDFLAARLAANHDQHAGGRAGLSGGTSAASRAR